MANLKNRILGVLKNSENIEEVLNDLIKYQDILLKNNSKSVFKDEDKSKILDEYNSLKILGKSLYRYNMLNENNFSDEAEKEKENIENIILRGGISYNRYIWHSENGEHTCDECSSLDGQIFDSIDEIPEKPHPNCKCMVEILDDNSDFSKNKNNAQHCDVIYEIGSLISDIEDEVQKNKNFLNGIEKDIQDVENDISLVQNLIQDTDFRLNLLIENYGKHLPDCENNVDIDYEYTYAKKLELQILLKDVYGLLNPVNAFFNTVKIFVSNYIELLQHAYILKEKEMDKYYHSKANCEAVQEFGIIGQEFAKSLSDSKEKYDQYTYIHTHKVTLEEAIADSERDQVANKLGRERGRKYPNCDCATLMHDLLPDYKK